MKYYKKFRKFQKAQWADSNKQLKKCIKIGRNFYFDYEGKVMFFNYTYKPSDRIHRLAQRLFHINIKNKWAYNIYDPESLNKYKIDAIKRANYLKNKENAIH